MSEAASLPGGRRGQALALAMTAVGLAVLWAAVIDPLVGWHAERAAQLEQRRAVASRMAGLAAILPDLKAQANAIAADGPAQGTLIEGASDAVAGATLQERIQDMAGTAGASLASLETLPAEQAGAWRRIGVRVTLATAWPVAVALMQAIEQATPRMLLDDVQIQSTILAQPGEPQPLTASFTVLAFRAGTAPPESARPDPGRDQR